ncbi:Lrp/AsnC family transcriptional regulator [Streptosporangium sp. NPDC023825]|uniref:Lrp/AsnC family transcriptional regulator n=1 Tax=Streptosporangium sp. NPDC023825 TaxID=3154909 RepID=UPI0034322A5D
MAESLDATDWSILVEVQRDGRIPITELGRRVNLSASATTERVRRLEATGVITGYHANVDLEKAGFPLLAVVRVSFSAVNDRACSSSPSMASTVWSASGSVTHCPARLTA